jgi:hypothetical protein
MNNDINVLPLSKIYTLQQQQTDYGVIMTKSISRMLISCSTSVYSVHFLILPSVQNKLVLYMWRSKIGHKVSLIIPSLFQLYHLLESKKHTQQSFKTETVQNTLCLICTVDLVWKLFSQQNSVLWLNRNHTKGFSQYNLTCY